MKHKGHLERIIDPDTGEVDDKRVWLVNNQIVFTDDGFKTSKSVLGEFKITNENGQLQSCWGLLAQAIVAGLVEGSEIRGGTINIGNGKFVVHDNGKVEMNAPDTKINSDQIDGIVNKIDVIEKKKMYRAEITCKDPLILKNRGQTATLNAKIMSWDDDETENLRDKIQWRRKSNNPDSDTDWHRENRDRLHGPSLTISTDDVAINASFYCEVEI